MNEHLVTPEPPDPLVEEQRAFWRGMGRTMLRESIGTLDEVARQIVVVAGILEGLYFHAIAFSDLRGKVTGDLLLTIYMLPIFLLLVSLSAALLVFFPKSYEGFNIHSSEASRAMYDHVRKRKKNRLAVASVSLALGILCMFVTVYVYLSG